MKHTRTCSTCAHDGCCADLHYCGGKCWEPAGEDDVEDTYERDPWEGYDEQDAADQWAADHPRED